MNINNKVSVIITTFGRDIRIVKEAVESADNQRTRTAGVPVCTVWRPDEAGSVQRGEGRTCV